MKTFKALFLTLGLILFASTALTVNAQSLYIVDANPNAPQGENYFSDLQTAIDEVNVGDTLLVVPHANFYTADLYKQLVIKGIGLDVRNIQNQFRSRINLDIVDRFNQIPDGTVIEGVEARLNSGFSDYDADASSLIVIRNSIVSRLSFPTNRTAPKPFIRARNCIFISYSNRSRGRIENSVLPSLSAFVGTFRNNIVFSSPEFGDPFNPSDPDYISSNVYNNIFLGEVSANTSAFNNNLFSENLTIDTNGTGNVASTNLFNLVPIFETFNGNDFPGIFDNDYRLRSTSPGLGFGTDGTDIGVFGGDFPFVQFDTGILLLPAVRNMEVTGVVSEGGEIRLEATVGNSSNN